MSLRLADCQNRHLLIDGGSNLGEGAVAWLGGAMHRCALHSPNRLYGEAWQRAGRRERGEMMAPLAKPKEWCVRSFEANPLLLAGLRAKEAELRAQGAEVRFQVLPAKTETIKTMIEQTIPDVTGSRNVYTARQYALMVGLLGAAFARFGQLSLKF